MDDTRPFPIQQQLRSSHFEPHHPACTIPWWLAEIAYTEYSRRYGTSQSLERLAERGGFGREELLSLIRREDPFGPPINTR